MVFIIILTDAMFRPWLTARSSKQVNAIPAMIDGKNFSVDTSIFNFCFIDLVNPNQHLSLKIFEVFLANEIILNNGNIHLSNLNSENIVIINTIFFFLNNRVCKRFSLKKKVISRISYYALQSTLEKFY